MRTGHNHNRFFAALTALLAAATLRAVTLEDLEREADDPESIFRRFCQDCAGLDPDEHLLSLFREAQADYERSVQG